MKKNRKDYIWLSFFVALFFLLNSSGVMIKYGEEAKIATVIFFASGWYLLMFGYVNLIQPIKRKLRKLIKKSTQPFATEIECLTKITIKSYRNQGGLSNI